MKKFNIKALLVLVLSFMLIFALTACDDDPVPPEPPAEPTASEVFLEAMGGLDATVGSLSDLTDTFDVDLDLYAIVNDVEYLVSIKANLDISEDGNNDNNKIAIEVTEEDQEVIDLVFGFYYNGAEKSVFVNIPSQEISRYMDGIDLYDLATMANKEEGQDYYTSFIDFSLVESAGSILGTVGEMLFDQKTYSVQKSGDKTTYTFAISEKIFTNTLPFALTIVGDGLDGLVDTIFGTEGFKLSEMTIPPLDASLIIVNGANGFEELKILADVEAFKFKINNEDAGKDVSALSIEAGLRLNTIAPKGTDYAVSLSVPSFEDGDYDYFSPANIETSGTLQIDENVYFFDVKTDINPLKIEEAEIYLNVTENESTLILIRTYEGIMYLEGSVFDEGPIQVSVEDAIDLVKDLIKNLDKIALPDLGEVTGIEDEEETETDKEPDILGALMLIPNAITDNGLYADKELIDDVLETLGLTFEEMKEDVTFEVAFELDEEEEKVIKVTGELWMANIVDPEAETIEYEEEELYDVVIDINYDADDDISSFDIAFTEGEGEAQVTIYEGTLEILYVGTGEEKSFDGFDYSHTVYKETGNETLLVKLTDFTFTWGNEVVIDQTGYEEIEFANYADGLEGVTALSIITQINDLIAELFSNETAPTE